MRKERWGSAQSVGRYEKECISPEIAQPRDVSDLRDDASNGNGCTDAPCGQHGDLSLHQSHPRGEERFPMPTAMSTAAMAPPTRTRSSPGAPIELAAARRPFGLCARLTARRQGERHDWRKKNKGPRARSPDAEPAKPFRWPPPQITRVSPKPTPGWEKSNKSSTLAWRRPWGGTCPSGVRVTRAADVPPNAFPPRPSRDRTRPVPPRRPAATPAGLGNRPRRDQMGSVVMAALLRGIV